MRVSKTPDKLMAIFAKVICLCFALGILQWIDIIVPMTRTHFANYQAYLDNRIVRESYGSIYFEKELPIGAEDIKYYAEHVIIKKVTAYSMILPEDTYMDLKESRINFYMEEADDREACSLLYVLQGDEYQYIDSLELYDVKLDYVDNVLHHPEARQQYYFGVIMKTNTSHECYNGIIANVSAREIIEFSAELPDDYGEYKEPERHHGRFDWIPSILVIALIVLIIKGMYVLDKKLDEKMENKANKN
ncbi:MAG: hypothetical protein K2O32_06270 [Acetatifactor sp.]|nr:hypothetical protein [Acetatifactor sp.]